MDTGTTLGHVDGSPPGERPGPIGRIRLDRCQDGQRVRREDEVASEEPVEIRVVPSGQEGSIPIGITMRTPGHDFELAAGFLFSEGVVRQNGDITRIDYCAEPVEAQTYNVVNVHLGPRVDLDVRRLSRHMFTSSSCGVCGKASLEHLGNLGARAPNGTTGFSPDLLGSLPARARKAQPVFERTGGIHAAALFDARGELRLAREDVGRHNALDKLVGRLLLDERLPASDTILLLSGRTSFELVQKALLAGIPTVASIGAPSSLAVRVAAGYGMTLVGFLRENTCNVYSGTDRVRA
jgi:FdhD protein